jgi:putative Ig domain-containing protein
MKCRPRHLVRAFLPLIPLCLCHGCGGGGGGSTASAASSTPPAVVAPPPSAPVSVNAPPTISAAVTEDATVGATFDFQPVARDPDGDALRFSAANLPTWASLDPSSGRISGTPGVNDVGVYESISITVADATHQVATSPFSITVIQALEAGTGVASLQWAVPGSKVNGSPLDDLAGYRILYGRDSSDLDQSVLITDPTMTSYQFSTLPSGIWYFAVVAVNAGGLEGPATTVASKSI